MIKCDIFLFVHFSWAITTVTSRFITTAAVTAVTVNWAQPNQHIQPFRQAAHHNLTITFHHTEPERRYLVELVRKLRQRQLEQRPVRHRRLVRHWIVSESILVNAYKQYSNNVINSSFATAYRPSLGVRTFARQSDKWYLVWLAIRLGKRDRQLHKGLIYDAFLSTASFQTIE